MLLAQKSYVEGALALCLYCARLVDLEKTDADSAVLLGLLTPIVKTWPSEYGLKANDIAIQVHGGYGYTRDFDVEQLWRDNRLNSIHEGTTGIQGIDLLGRKILRDKRAIQLLDLAINQTARNAEKVQKLARQGQELEESWSRILSAIKKLEKIKDGSAFDNATLFLRALGHVVVAWQWLEQALTASELLNSNQGDTAFNKGKIAACQYFYEFELPLVQSWLSPVLANSGMAMSLQEESF